MYITDFNNSRVQVVSFTGNFLSRFGQDVFKKPWGIALTEDNVFVTDNFHHALLQFSKDYKLVRRTGTQGSGEGELNYSRGLCIDNNGDVYVADEENNRVSVFSKDLEFLKFLCAQLLMKPLDVKVTQTSVVVLDSGLNCISSRDVGTQHARLFLRGRMV